MLLHCMIIGCQMAAHFAELSAQPVGQFYMRSPLDTVVDTLHNSGTVE